MVKCKETLIPYKRRGKDKIFPPRPQREPLPPLPRRAPAPTSIPVTLGRAVQVRLQRSASLPLDGLGGPVPSVAGEKSAGVDVSGESRRAAYAAGPRERQFRADAVGAVVILSPARDRWAQGL